MAADQFVIAGLLTCPLCRADITVTIDGHNAPSHYPCLSCGTVFRLPARAVLTAAEAVCSEFAAAEAARRGQAQAAMAAMGAQRRAQAATVRDG